MFISKYLGGDRAGFLAKMKEYALLFREAFDPQACRRAVSAEHDEDRMSVVVFGMELLTLVPYLLYLYHEVNDAEEREKLFSLLESYVMRRVVVRANNRSYGNLFLSFVANGVTTTDDLSCRLAEQADQVGYMPQDDEVRAQFGETRLTNKVSRGVLYLLESGMRPKESSTSLLGLDNYSLEHMMPKKWRNNWAGPANGTDDARARDIALQTLGNLAIITRALNSAVRDSSWQTKLEGKGGKPGLRDCAAGLSTMFDTLHLDEWDESTISKRSRKLGEAAINVWPSIV